MTKEFNELLTLGEIIDIYKGGKVPKAMCLLWNQDAIATLLITENNNVLLTQDERGIEV